MAFCPLAKAGLGMGQAKTMGVVRAGAVGRLAGKNPLCGSCRPSRAWRQPGPVVLAWEEGERAAPSPFPQRIAHRLGRCYL